MSTYKNSQLVKTEEQSIALHIIKINVSCVKTVNIFTYKNSEYFHLQQKSIRPDIRTSNLCTNKTN